MPKLKFKNGSTWTEMQLGGIGGTLNQEYPAGTFYVSPMSLYAAYENTSNLAGYIHTYDIQSISTPAQKFGGNWLEIQPATNTSAYPQGYNWVGYLAPMETYSDNFLNANQALFRYPSYKHLFLGGSTIASSIGTITIPKYVSGSTQKLSFTGLSASLHWDSSSEYAYSRTGQDVNLTQYIYVVRVWQRIS